MAIVRTITKKNCTTLNRHSNKRAKYNQKWNGTTLSFQYYVDMEIIPIFDGTSYWYIHIQYILPPFPFPFPFWPSNQLDPFYMKIKLNNLCTLKNISNYLNSSRKMEIRGILTTTVRAYRIDWIPRTLPYILLSWICFHIRIVTDIQPYMNLL